MRYGSLFIIMLLFVVGCSSSTSTSTVACVTPFWNGAYGTCLPQGWRALSASDLHNLGVPEETTAAFQRSQSNAGQFSTVTVTEEPLPAEMQTTDYSAGNIMAVSVLPEYALIDKITAYVDGKETFIHVFSARPSPDSPLRRYYQLSAVHNAVGYTFTGSFPLGVTDAETSEVRLILSSVSFVDPATKKA